MIVIPQTKTRIGYVSTRVFRQVACCADILGSRVDSRIVMRLTTASSMERSRISRDCRSQGLPCNLQGCCSKGLSGAGLAGTTISPCLRRSKHVARGEAAGNISKLISVFQSQRHTECVVKPDRQRTNARIGEGPGPARKRDFRAAVPGRASWRCGRGSSSGRKTFWSGPKPECGAR